MNFIFQDKEEIDLSKEVVIVINTKLTKKVILNFPEDRFNKFKEKYDEFIKKINGKEEVNEENNYKYILSNKEDYEIYETFYLIFY
jgi:hypothetical protein